MNQILADNVRFIRYWRGSTILYLMPFPFRKYHSANLSKGHVPRDQKVLDEFVRYNNINAFKFTKKQLLTVDFEEAYQNNKPPFN